FDLPKERINGPSSFFVSPGAIGPRLVRTERLPDRAAAGRTTPASGGAIVVEQALAGPENIAPSPDTVVLSTSLVPVTVRAHIGGSAATSEPVTSIVSSRSGGLVLEADISVADIRAARDRWRQNTLGAVIAILGLTLALCAGPILEIRRRTSRRKADASAFIASTLALAAVVIAALALLLYALRNSTGSAAPTSPAVLLLVAMTALALVAMTLDLIERRRIVRARARLARRGRTSVALAWYAAAGAAGAGLLAVYVVVLRRI